VINPSMWANGDSRQDEDVIDSVQNRENTGLMNELTSIRGESFFNPLQPKVRPFDVACTSSKLKLKKQTNATNYLQTGRMLKYLDSLTSNLSASTKDSLVTSYRLHPEPLDDSNSFTGVDTLTYSEVVRHLTTLRTEHVQRFIRPVLQRLLLHPKNVGNLFNKPVDPIALQLPDYFMRIKRPMDLGTVKSRLQRGFYKNMESVTADIHLVFKNALTYNAANHAIHLIAKTMKADFESDLAALEEKCTREVMIRSELHSHFN
jgi:Bromodomain